MATFVQQPSEVFETSDLNLASFLRCRSFQVRSLRRDNARVLFVFENSPELGQAVVDFVNDGTVGVRSFCNTMRDLKGLVRDTGSRKRTAPEENGL